MPVTAIRTMPTLDVTKLSPRQLEMAAAIFDDMRDRQFLPATKPTATPRARNWTTASSSRRWGCRGSVLEPLALLRLKWCSEPSVHGGKRTAPPDAAS